MRVGSNSANFALIFETAKLISFAISTILFLLYCSCPALMAEDGDLLPNFGESGKVRTDFAGSFDSAADVALQSDGKIVVAGDVEIDFFTKFGLARYKPDGTLDDTFGSDGKVVVDSGIDHTLRALSVAIQDDGKIVAAGSRFVNGDTDFFLARLNPDGSLDPTFGNDGLLSTDLGSIADIAEEIVIQADEKIVVAGRTNIGGSSAFAVLRYDPDGSLDSSFDFDGMVFTSFPGNSAYGFDVGIQDDGRIIVAGTLIESGTLKSQFVLTRYNPDGSLDNTFDFDGIVTTDFLGNQCGAQALGIQSDGKIVAGGYVTLAGDNDFAIARYNQDGNLDPTFGSNGLKATGFSANDDGVSEIAFQTDGKIVAAGIAETDTFSDFALARYNIDGNEDPNFGDMGRVTTDFIGGDDNARSLAIRPDGSIVLAGHASADLALSAYVGRTYLFFDEFDGPLNWQIKKGQWMVNGQQLIGTGETTAIAFAPVPWFPSGESSCTNCTIETTIRTAGGPFNKVFLTAWFQNGGNKVDLLMKELNDKWVLKQKVGGIVAASQKVSHRIDPGLTYRVRLGFDGTLFHVFVDDEEIITMPAAATPSGNVGLKIKNTSATFDFIWIY